MEHGSQNIDHHSRGLDVHWNRLPRTGAVECDDGLPWLLRLAGHHRVSFRMTRDVLATSDCGSSRTVDEIARGKDDLPSAVAVSVLKAVSVVAEIVSVTVMSKGIENEVWEWRQASREGVK